VLVKDRRPEGKVDGKEIFSVKKVEIFRVTQRLETLNSAEVRKDLLV